MQLIPGTVVAERFRLIRQLGAGGMGAVWLAQHMGLGIPCAVKFILGEPSPEMRARFEREARAAAQIRSPHVVQVLDSGIYEGTPYMAMEYLEGEDLAHRLKRVGRLSINDTAIIIGQVGRALSRAHTAGLVHRDLKPENIFLVRDEDREIAKVLDFGIAKDNAASSLDGSTRTGALLGTPYYMSPEQARGVKAVDHRADLWSISVVAFQCVTGRLPFISDALGDLLIQIIMNPIPLPSQVAPGIPQTFDAWWMRAAQRDPAQRFQSAKELADSLAMASGVSLDSQMGASAPGTLALPAMSPGMSGMPLGPSFPGQPTPNPSYSGVPNATPNPSFSGQNPGPNPSFSGGPNPSFAGGGTVQHPSFNGSVGSPFSASQGGAMGMGTNPGSQPAPMVTTSGVVAAAVLGEPPRSKGGMTTAIVIGVAGAVMIMGAAAVFLLRSHDAPPASTTVAAAAPAPPPPPAPTPSATAEAAPVPSAVPSAAPDAPPSASPAAAAPVHTPVGRGGPRVPAAPPPPPAAPTPPPAPPKGGGAKDFGF